MMGTTPVCTISATGIYRPSLSDVLAYFVAQFQSIYGSDAYLGSDSQDGEWIGILSAAVDDCNAMAEQAYNAFSPATAQGTGLSSVVKINGLKRATPSYSTAPMLVVGVAGTTIAAGLVKDENSYVWALPDNLVIPSSGQIATTATCQTLGAIAASIGTITGIINPTRGWQSAANTAAATAGAPVEIDATLRVRQSNSTMDSSTGILEGLEGAILALSNVARVRGYENSGNLPDANGIPGHCIALVIDGGDAQTIANTIVAKKGGCGTYGTTGETVTDAYGAQAKINFFEVIEPPITYALTIKPLKGYTTDVLAQIQASLANWTNARGIGNGVQYNRAYAAAYLFGAANGQTFEIVSLAVARDGAVPTAADVPIAFNEAPVCIAAYVTVSVQN
jgi:hypothetical protein